MISAIKFYRISNYLFRKKIPIIPNIFQHIIFYLYNSYIPFKAEIGLGSDFGYGGIGVVLHERCKIGNNVMIGTNVTIGGRSGKFDVPVIGNNVYIATGAKVLGAINVGNNVIIGANAVVINDIPDNSVVAGVPARIIKHNRVQHE